ncbi:uncharacterized protein BKA55DRAFT_553673 [Fusarium redolens]|uniref:Uncharacterized protein n=1 Tax=Fusarium redolens TaxID=48865 RepID=A0A9P9R3V1_FUSRE|nr:uncharacterized protein BKA55DRAFT_553673 [Fusarium redolens]KAH7266901.1 hypothetical protein BKA55DRAFT_553673 [Fusarium redolens]
MHRTKNPQLNLIHFIIGGTCMNRPCSTGTRADGWRPGQARDGTPFVHPQDRY